MGYSSMTVKQLQKRADEALSLMESCCLCSRYCGANRTEKETGACLGGRLARVSSFSPHFGEERVLVGTNGSGTIFFAGCNLKCVFCQNYDISHCREGRDVSAGKLGEIMIALQESGCHNINLVSPTHYVPQILEGLATARQLGLSVPLVYNTGGYDSPEILGVLDGLVDIYMPDIKFGDDETAEKYTGVKNYFTTTRIAVKEMHRQVGDLETDERDIALRGLLVRHLVLPGNLAHTDRVLEFVAGEISPNTWINIMDQYHPAHQAFRYENLSRRITRREYREALDLAGKLGLKCALHDLL